jgi:hypothetical protein
MIRGAVSSRSWLATVSGQTTLSRGPNKLTGQFLTAKSVASSLQ